MIICIKTEETEIRVTDSADRVMWVVLMPMSVCISSVE